MGTSLFELGLQAGSTPELWNVEFPERIVKVHQGFVDAGADIILTNTFVVPGPVLISIALGVVSTN